MLYAKKKSWLLKQLEGNINRIKLQEKRAEIHDTDIEKQKAKICYIQEIVEYTNRCFILSDGCFFIKAVFEQSAFIDMMKEYNPTSIMLKGAVIAIEKYSFSKNSRNAMELLVKKAVYLGEGRVVVETLDINKHLTKQLYPHNNHIYKNMVLVDPGLENMNVLNSNTANTGNTAPYYIENAVSNIEADQEQINNKNVLVNQFKYSNEKRKSLKQLITESFIEENNKKDEQVCPNGYTFQGHSSQLSSIEFNPTDIMSIPNTFDISFKPSCTIPTSLFDKDIFDEIAILSKLYTADEVQKVDLQTCSITDENKFEEEILFSSCQSQASYKKDNKIQAKKRKYVLSSSLNTQETVDWTYNQEKEDRKFVYNGFTLISNMNNNVLHRQPVIKPIRVFKSQAKHISTYIKDEKASKQDVFTEQKAKWNSVINKNVAKDKETRSTNFHGSFAQRFISSKNKADISFMKQPTAISGLKWISSSLFTLKDNSSNKQYENDLKTWEYFDFMDF